MAETAPYVTISVAIETFVLVWHDIYADDADVDLLGAYLTRDAAEAAKLDAQRRVSALQPDRVGSFEIIPTPLYGPFRSLPA